MARIKMAMIDYSCKPALKVSCLQACNGDLAQARELYDYLTDGLADLPEMPPTRPSTAEVLRDSAESLIGWAGEHQDTLMQGLTLIQALRSKLGGSAK